MSFNVVQVVDGAVNPGSTKASGLPQSVQTYCYGNDKLYSSVYTFKHQRGQFATNNTFFQSETAGARPRAPVQNQHAREFLITAGGVYVPCIYSYARRVTLGDSGLCCCVCVTSFGR